MPSRTEPTIADMVEFFLPLLVSAGDFAADIQPRIRQQGAKAGGNAWTSALTDADVAVQTFFEVATLARYPRVGFCGEEAERSPSARYFEDHASTVVWLDPINGTFLYQSQRPGWDIVLSIAREGQLEAAISYMPIRGQFYLAVRGLGALTGDRSQTRLATMSPLRVMTGSRRLLTYQAPDVLDATRASLESFDIVTDDDAARDFDNLNDLFTGRLDGFAVRNGDLLDWGAMTFIAGQAGAIVTAPDGRPVTCMSDFDGARQADLLVTVNSDLHDEILGLVSQRA